MKKMWKDSGKAEGFREQRIKGKEQRPQRSFYFLLSTFYFRLFKAERLREPRIKSQEPRLYKNFILVIGFVIIASSFLILNSCQQKTAKDQQASESKTYTCPMHPQIIEDHPGTCPICGMDLVLRNPKAIKMEVDAELSKLLQPTNEAIISNIETIEVTESTQSDSIRLNGTVSYNTNNLKTISSRVGGRIEKLYVKYNFQKVNKGQLLMEIYSPELASAQQELLYLKSKGDLNLMEQAKSKLRLLGVSENQLNQIIQSGKVNYRIPIYSSASGYLVDSQSNLNPTPAADGNIKPMNTENSSLNLLEGAYVKTGDVLFKLFNDVQVWGTFYVDAQQINNIQKNQSIKIRSNAKDIAAKVDLIQPYYNNGQSYSVLRVYLSNVNHDLKIGELLTGEIMIPDQTGFWIPTEAVYQLGNRNIVFIKQKDVLKPKEVMISGKAKSKVLIKIGLSEGDEIAKNASYLIDTESFIKTIN